MTMPDPQPTEQTRDGTQILMDTSQVLNPRATTGIPEIQIL